MAQHDSASRGEHVDEMQFDAPLFIRLTLRQRYFIDMLIDSHEREAQIGLARVALRVAVDETSPNPIAHKRSRAGIEDGSPDHKSGDRIVLVAEAQREIARKHPEHPGEGAEQDRRLQ